MPKHIVISNPVTQVHPEIFAVNDGTPSPTGMSKVASAFNYVSCRQKKVILVRAQSHISADNSSAINTCWPHYFRTGENTSSLVIRMGVTLSDGSVSASDISYSLRVFSTGDSSDTLVAGFTHQTHGQMSAGALSPSDVFRRSFHIDGLSPNTEYHGRFGMTNSARIVYATIHEAWEMVADDSVNAVCNPDVYQAEGPIYDAHALDLTRASNALWRHNGAPYIGWTPSFNSSAAPSTTSAVFADLMPNSRGQYVNTQYHSTRRRTGSAGVPVKMGVKTFFVGSSCNAEFRLTDGTNNIDITGVTVPSATNERWFTTTATISDTPATWRMQARRTSGTGEVAVCGWALFPYEA